MKVFFLGKTAQNVMSLGVDLQPGVNEVGKDQGKRLLALKTLCRKATTDESRAFEERKRREAAEARKREEQEAKAAAEARVAPEVDVDDHDDDPEPNVTPAPTDGDVHQ